ncbi:MAG: tetratricopeptide repeat protein [Spirochaetaceae bacterium]|nr:tetratricopeptide repeat protein [Spirochaetaceae bacterium]
MKRKIRRERLVLVLLAAAVLASSITACGEDGELRKLFDIESRISKGAPPRTTEEIKAAIAQYSEEAKRTVEATAKVGTYYELLATRYMGMKMYGDAYDALQSAIKHFPDAPGLYYNSGLSAAHLAKAEGAKGIAGTAERDKWLSASEAAYKRAIETKSTYGDALYGLSILYSFELGRPAEAIPLLTRLVGIETKNADAMMLLGRCLYQEDRLEEAAHWYETAAQITVVPDKREAAKEARATILSEIGGEGGLE